MELMLIMSYGKKQSRKILGGKYYWELQDWANQLFLQYNRCVVCGDKDRLEPHHCIPVKQFDSFYTDINNGVIMCKDCHREYHQLYGEDINPRTLIDFTVKKYKGKGYKNSIAMSKSIKKKNKVIKYYKNENNKLKDKLNDMGVEM